MSKKRGAERSWAEWDRLVDEWSSSGQKQGEFSLAHGINPKTFQGHVWRSRKRRGLTLKGKGIACRFVEVSPQPPVEAKRFDGCRITMSKTEIEFSSSSEADWVLQILSTLGHGK